MVNIELNDASVPPPPVLEKHLTLHRRIIMRATSGSSPKIRLRDAEDGVGEDSVSEVTLPQKEIETETLALHRGPSSHESVLGEKILDLVEDREPNQGEADARPDEPKGIMV